MPAAENEQALRRLFDVVWNQNRPELAAECLAPDAVAHPTGGAGDASGASPFSPSVNNEALARWRTGFPDLRYTIEALVAVGDTVFANTTVTGTHAGVFAFGPWRLAPTGKRIEVREALMVRVAGGRITELWPTWDRLSLLEQLGAVSPWAQPRA